MNDQLKTIDRGAAELDALVNQPRFRFVHVGQMKPHAPSWLIRHILEIDSLALVFGDPGCCKTFLAIDWACAVATGKEWNSCRVKQSPVMYIAGEGHNGIARRLRAWSIRHNIDLADAPLYISTMPAALSDPTTLAHVEAAIDEIAATHGKPALIVIDTLARNFGPGDENSTQDMTAFIAAADAIRCNYKAAVLLVHHTGHGDKTRARGAMALKGALDAEFRMDKDEMGTVRMEATKTKDGASPQPMAFKLNEVDLGITDDEGAPVTSAVLDVTRYEPPARKGKEGRGKWQVLALETLGELQRRHRDNLEANGHDPESARVTLDDWRLECVTRGMPRQRFAEARDKLIEQGKVINRHGFASC